MEFLLIFLGVIMGYGLVGKRYLWGLLCNVQGEGDGELFFIFKCFLLIELFMGRKKIDIMRWDGGKVIKQR